MWVHEVALLKYYSLVLQFLPSWFLSLLTFKWCRRVFSAKNQLHLCLFLCPEHMNSQSMLTVTVVMGRALELTLVSGQLISTVSDMSINVTPLPFSWARIYLSCAYIPCCSWQYMLDSTGLSFLSVTDLLIQQFQSHFGLFSGFCQAGMYWWVA